MSLRGNWRKKKALPSRKLTQKNRGNCIYAVLEVDDELVLPSAGTKKKNNSYCLPLILVLICCEIFSLQLTISLLVTEAYRRLRNMIGMRPEKSSAL